ncbi:MAG TPA: HAMP domain-containing sensor histidine kinase [Candidatus Polarisedimenticolaceae bacterium]|nr:HAMP domain-containing sensor histidine kinase [Candidatus Polarisedimenticolaceae bacterium]
MRGTVRALRRRWRSAVTVALLSGTLVIVAVLTLQAQFAWTYHRTTAENVLRDYSRLVAEEFIRRTSQEIGYRGFFSVVTALQQSLGGVAAPVLIELAEIPGGLDDARAPRELVRTLFLVDPETGSVETKGVPLDAETAAVLRQRIGSSLPASGERAGPFSAIQLGDEAGQRIVIVVPIAAPAGSSARLAGFEVDTAGLSTWLRRMVDSRPLLPASLGDGELTNDLLFLRLSDATGRVIFTSGTWPGPLLATETPMGDAYGGVFDGLTLTVCIDPAAAPRLVIGGLPRSRLPVLSGLLLLTAGLLGAAVWQMRRERALARMRSEFVGRVSHELRTPLTQIRMFAETLSLGRTRTPAEHRRSVEIIDQEARRLGHLVENILQFSREERGATCLAPRPLELAPLVRDVIEKFQPVASARRVRLATDLVEDAMVLADDEAIRQVFLNLLDNAVKYGPAGQEVRVGLERTGRMVRATVEDEGPGVPERDRERIWARWQRLDRDERRAISGTGIGLTVVRELVSLHGGRTWVEPGRRRGARFVVELPVTAGGTA